MYRIPELLAPAGGMEQLKAAVENGADAVYMGGKLFNARINAENFSDEETKEAVTYAHLRGVKLYATMNTLIKDSELSDALNYAATLYKLGVDALIIQDMGFAALVRKHIPDFELHLSTQGTIYNAEGVKMAKQLGFSRVVLARELTLNEIREITDQQLLEIEVFAHGALCICYSGQCQMSREIGGRSGNRGECAQPCRLPYSICRTGSDSETRPDSGREIAGPSFALSPKDLCTVEQLDKLSEAGISSLKIEGRMKNPEYVAVVTGIYRKYLDLYAKNGSYDVDPSDLRDLAQIFNRGGFTEGYLLGNPKKDLMSGDLSKHQGIYIGKVISSTGTAKSAGTASEGRKPDRQRGLVTLRLADRLAVGDGVEIRSKDLPGNIVTFMKCEGKKAEFAGKGEVVTIGYIDGAISPGDKVYKITDKELMRQARRTFEGKSGAAEKSMRKTEVVFRFSAGLDKPVALSATDQNGNTVTKELPERAEKALTRPLTIEAVKAQLSKTGGTPFRIEGCFVDIEDDISLPLSKINELRRSVLEDLERLRGAERAPVQINWSLPSASPKADDELEEEIFLYLYRVNGEIPADPAVSRIYVPYEAVLKGFYQDDRRVVPVIPAITKGLQEYNIRKNFDKIVTASEAQGVAVGNPGWIAPFVSAGVRVIGDYGLNLFNSADFMLARELGIKEAVISHEADSEEIAKLNFHGVIPEVAAGGRIPVMISEHCPVGDLSFNCRDCSPEKGCPGLTGYSLKDRRGQYYPILTDSYHCRSLILSHKEINLLKTREEMKKAGVRRFRIYTW